MFGEIHFLSRDGDRLDGPVDEPVADDPSADESAHSLTGLRTYMTANTSARIVIGGKRAGFQGDMPGILEEVLFALERKQPLYLAGGFGGAALDAIRSLRPSYAEWFPPAQDAPAQDQRLLKGLERIEEAVAAEQWDGFENGLSEDENRLLAASYRPSEIAALVGRGMGRLIGA
ncbi:hypothetical protein CCR85_08320 [Rhodothalassium salexigens]|nr:hypothetical protein [Rhodothalassium salexigens]